MHRHRFKRLVHSVFTKLLVAILVAGIAITVTVMAGFYHIRFHRLSFLDRSLLLYAEYIIRDLGEPPDFDRAVAIARRTGLVIRYDHPQRTTWQTGKIPGIALLDPDWMKRRGNGIWTGHHAGHYFLRLPHAGGDLTFIAPRGDHEITHWLLVSIALVLVIVLAGAYFFIRRVLEPLRTLETGVAELTAGRLEHRVAETGNDEFRDLAEAFNTMAKRLSELLANKERLLIDMSHELRSPLTRMKVQLEFLGDEDIRESLRADVREMESMVTAILDEARLRNSATALNLEKLELGELIGSVMNDFKDRAPGLTCGPLEPTHVQADREKIRMVLRNLLDNAFKHTPEGGAPVEIAMVRHSDGIAVVIEDHGEGIPASSLPHLFEPFFRADSSRSRKTGGYGLGLSLCKAIIDAHRGRIDISSRPGKGTRVSITFPLDF